MQVTKLIEDSTVSKTVKNAIDTDKLLDWLVENSVLSIALEGTFSLFFFLEAKLCIFGFTIKGFCCTVFFFFSSGVVLFFVKWKVVI